EMGPGEQTTRPSRLGEQRFTYKGHQPAYGSIRRFLDDMDLGIGDEIFCVFKNDGTFDVERLPEPSSGGLAEALRLVGADPTSSGDDARAALAAAVACDPDSGLAAIA